MYLKHFQFILYCVIFNLLFEYSARGITEFTTRPILILFLFAIYFTYFTMLEDLIVRFRLANYQIFLIAFLYGLFPTAFLTGNLFNQQIYNGIIVAGINIGTLLIVGILAWGVVQGIITLYFANRLLQRNWDHPRMGVIGWFLVVLIQVGILAVAQLNPVTPRGSFVGYIVVLLLVIICVGLFALSVKGIKREISVFQKSYVIDFLAFGSVVLFLILGTFFVSGPIVVTSQPLHLFAVRIENYWVFFCAAVFFIYRFWKRADITV